MKGRSHFLERWYEGVKVAARQSPPKLRRTFAGICFIEAPSFPNPPDVMLIPMVQAAPGKKPWRLRSSPTHLSSVLGGGVRLSAGSVFWVRTLLAMPVLESFGKAEAVTDFSHRVEEYGAIAVCGGWADPFSL